MTRIFDHDFIHAALMSLQQRVVETDMAMGATPTSGWRGLGHVDPQKPWGQERDLHFEFPALSSVSAIIGPWFAILHWNICASRSTRSRPSLPPASPASHMRRPFSLCKSSRQKMLGRHEDVHCRIFPVRES